MTPPKKRYRVSFWMGRSRHGAAEELTAREMALVERMFCFFTNRNLIGNDLVRVDEHRTVVRETIER